MFLAFPLRPSRHAVSCGLRRRWLSGAAAVALLILTGKPSARGQAPSAPSQSSTALESVAITNVTVIDVARGIEERGWTVVTEGERITRVGAMVQIPPGAARVDGSGKFLIPGLWDMHSHNQATGIESLDLFLVNGVIGTRDMGSDADFILPLRDRIRRRELRGPEIVAAGPILDDAPPDYQFRRRVRNAEEAREAVRDLKLRGVDFIKVHDHTPRDAFFAIADETRKLGLPFAGHVPLAVKVTEAAASGMRSIEHLSNYEVFGECSDKEIYDAAACAPLFDKLAANGVWETPTIVFFQTIPNVFSGQPLPHVEYASDSLLAATAKNVRSSKLTEQAYSTLRQLGKASLTAIRDLKSHGNRFLAGCDLMTPGFCLHDELEWLTRAGFSPLEALQTATINPALFLGREDSQGAIAAGKRADLVLLDADPLSDIVNTRWIAAVIVRGSLLRKPELERMTSAHRRPGAH